MCTQDNPYGTPTIRTDLVAVGRNNFPLPSQVINLAHPVPVLGELAIIGFGFIHHDSPSFGVNIFNRMPYGRQSAGQDSPGQPFGVGAEITHGSKAPERLSQQRPAFSPQVSAQGFGVSNNLICTQVSQVFCLLRWGQTRQRTEIRIRRNRGGSPGSALIEHNDLIVLQGAGQPGRLRRGVQRGPGRLMSGSALQEQQVGSLFPVLTGDDSCEYFYHSRGWIEVVQRHLQSNLT